jgi:iron complex outermembrane recepter protein
MTFIITSVPSQSFFRFRVVITPLAIASALIGPSVLAAQTVENQAPQVEASSEEPAAELDEIQDIVITGSRILTQQFDLANPVVGVDQSAIENAGVTNATSFLQDFPALTASPGAAQNTNDAAPDDVGLNLLNLRNLGTDRTLVLVDGRRHVGGVTGSAAVDISTIPIGLIERVDILTGGASAIYGADAVSGVVNFVLKRDFEGLSFNGQTGTSGMGDAASQFFSATAGVNFAEDRGNVAVSLEYGRDDALELTDRRRLSSENFPFFVTNTDDADDDPNVPDFVLARDVRFFDSSPTSGIDVDFDGLPDFIGDGTAFDPGIFAGDILQLGGSGTPQQAYNVGLLPKVERYIVNSILNYEFTDNVRVFAQGKYARVDSASREQPTFDFTMLVTADNPFLAPNVRDIIQSSPEGFAGVNRDNLDLYEGADNERETWRGVIGIEADLGDRMVLAANYVYGQSDVQITQTGARLNDRFFAAIDAVDEGEFLSGTPNGNVVCRSNLTGDLNASNQPFYNFGAGFFFEDFAQLTFTPGPNSGCVPFNLFSATQDPAAIAFVSTRATDRSSIRQDVADVSLAGDFGEGFKLWADPIGFAVGAEYRKEQSNSTPDPLNTTGLAYGVVTQPTDGSFNVKEVFGEIRVPVISDRPFVNDLTLNGAVRLSDYSTIGNTATYQIGGVYAPVQQLRFRGTYAQTVRAPNIGELFAPANRTLTDINDPCSPTFIDAGSENRAANCEALLAGLGLTPTQIENFMGALSTPVIGTISGNENLTEETAKTLTFGAVMQPSFIPGLVFSADYYSVKISDAVNTATVDEVLQLCVDQPTLDNVFCPQITRDPGSDPFNPGLVSGYQLQPENVAQIKTQGIDFSAQYTSLPGRFGRFNFDLAGTHLLKLTSIPIPGGLVVDERSTVFAPDWQVNFDVNWNISEIELTYGINYFSGTYRFTRQQLESQPDTVAPEFLKFKAKFTHDMQLGWNIDDRFSLYGGVNNLFDQQPDIDSVDYPIGSAIGRFFYFGVRSNLDKL